MFLSFRKSINLLGLNTCIRKGICDSHEGLFSSKLLNNYRSLRPFSLPPTQGLPKKKEEYGKRGPVSFKTLLITAGISGALLAFMLYVRREKEAGKTKMFAKKIEVL